LESEYMKVAEVAKRFNVTRFTIYNWLEKGVLVGINIEGIVRVLRSSVDALEQTSRIQPQAPKTRGRKKKEPSLG
jgi:excisionase family DNA binding protein